MSMQKGDAVALYECIVRYACLNALIPRKCLGSTSQRNSLTVGSAAKGPLLSLPLWQ